MAECRGFARGSHGAKTLRPRGNLEFDLFPKSFEVNLIVLKRRRQGDGQTGKLRSLPIHHGKFDPSKGGPSAATQGLTDLLGGVRV